MSEVVGFGIADEVRGSRSVSENLYFTRGARIAIAKKCISLYPLNRQMSMVGAVSDEAEEADAS